MRRLVWLGVIFVLAWSGWWLFAAQSLQTGVIQWFEDRRDEGWQADVSDTVKAGFPTRLELTLQNPALADPETGVAVVASSLAFDAPVWWPGHLTVVFPQDAVVLSTPLLRQTITATDSTAQLRLRPGADLQVQQMSLISQSWVIETAAGSIASGQGLNLELKQSQADPHSYDLRLGVPAFQPGTVPRQALRIPADWPLAFDSLVLNATVGLDRAIDRSTIEVARPQPRQIDLQLAEAIWGALSLRASAQLAVDPSGIPSGNLSLQVRNWQDMLQLAEAAGAAPKVLLPQLETVLGALARSSGNPETIDVSLTLRDGGIYLGFVPLGPAPRLILR